MPGCTKPSRTAQLDPEKSNVNWKAWKPERHQHIPSNLIPKRKPLRPDEYSVRLTLTDSCGPILALENRQFGQHICNLHPYLPQFSRPPSHGEVSSLSAILKKRLGQASQRSGGFKQSTRPGRFEVCQWRHVFCAKLEGKTGGPKPKELDFNGRLDKILLHSGVLWGAPEHSGALEHLEPRPPILSPQEHIIWSQEHSGALMSTRPVLQHAHEHNCCAQELLSI
ncbi:hypothetical protein BDV93DRAFT_507289 [Ceratobasidium sp. AG-I]|nr:hypothetical protein BDV93DRAFT_507289 [Ceratobasidium sp. AG-I]